MERGRELKQPEREGNWKPTGTSFPKAIPGMLRGTIKETKKKECEREMKRKRKKAGGREAHK